MSVSSLDVEPLAVPSTVGDRFLYEPDADALMPPGEVDGGIEEEEVDATVPGHVDKADQLVVIRAVTQVKLRARTGPKSHLLEAQANLEEFLQLRVDHMSTMLVLNRSVAVHRQRIQSLARG